MTTRHRRCQKSIGQRGSLPGPGIIQESRAALSRYTPRRREATGDMIIVCYADRILVGFERQSAGLAGFFTLIQVRTRPER